MTSTDVRFLPAHNRGGVIWAASATKSTPEIVNIHEHPFWKVGSDDEIARKFYRLFSHETLHHVLWSIDELAGTNYDLARNLFLGIMPDDDDCFGYL